MRGPRARYRPPAEGNPQSNGCAAGAGMDLDLARDLASPFPHAAQTVAVVNPGVIESAAIVDDSQAEPSVFHPEIDRDFGSTGMPQHVVNSLFEDEEDLPPQIGSHRQVLLLEGRLERKAYVARGENIAGETPHAMDQ